jgi:hypothetical protein
MEIFLRNKVNETYFQGVNDWTQQVQEAFNFQIPERALRFVRAAQLDPAQMEIVFAFGEPRYNVAVPMDERFEIKSAPFIDHHPCRVPCRG